MEVLSIEVEKTRILSEVSSNPIPTLIPSFINGWKTILYTLSNLGHRIYDRIKNLQKSLHCQQIREKAFTFTKSI